MRALPSDVAVVIAMFAPLSSQPTFEHVKLLLVGAMLAPGRRTVTAVLRIMGLAPEPQLQQYHRVLRARLLVAPPGGWHSPACAGGRLWRRPPGQRPGRNLGAQTRR